MYHQKLSSYIGKERTLLEEKTRNLDSHTKKAKDCVRELDLAKKAKVLVQSVAEDTQKRIQYHISNIVSNALSTVFPDPYQFKLNFVKKRGRTEAELRFEKDGYEYVPVDDSGGGVMDIASFALRLAMWGLEGSSQVVLLDEPSKHLSEKYQDRYCDLLRAVQEDLNIQFIIITHIEKLKASADTLITVAGGAIESNIHIERGIE